MKNSIIIPGKDISQIKFPAITICGQGWIGDVVTEALLDQYRGFATDKGWTPSAAEQSTEESTTQGTTEDSTTQSTTEDSTTQSTTEATITETTTENQPRRKREAFKITNRELNFGDNDTLEQEWIQAYYPGSFLHPKVSKKHVLKYKYRSIRIVSNLIW